PAADDHDVRALGAAGCAKGAPARSGRRVLMNGEAPIVVRDLKHFYGKGALRKQILFDISTEIPKGEIVIVTGPSGSGKTTMLTIVGALRSAQEGSVRILGEE